MKFQKKTVKMKNNDMNEDIDELIENHHNKILELMSMMNGMGIIFMNTPLYFEMDEDNNNLVYVMDSGDMPIGCITKELFDKLGSELTPLQKQMQRVDSF